MNNLQTVVTNAVNTCVPPRKPISIRKREISDRTKLLIAERQNNFPNMTSTEQKEATRAISNSSREDYRTYIDNIINDIAAASTVGNTREVTRLTKRLSGKSSQPSPMPSKDLQGAPITSSDQLLVEWNKFLSAKFAAPRHRQRS